MSLVSEMKIPPHILIELQDGNYRKIHMEEKLVMSDNNITSQLKRLVWDFDTNADLCSTNEKTNALEHHSFV